LASIATFSFIGERVYCGIEFNKALFEASIFKPVSFADVEFMHALFTLIETIITRNEFEYPYLDERIVFGS
jgi:hypothetical protein